MSIFLIFDRKDELSENPEWLKNISLHCGDQAAVNHLQFGVAELAAASLGLYPVGAYCGLLLDARKFNGTSRNINQTGVSKTIVRLGIQMFIITIIILLPLLFRNV